MECFLKDTAPLLISVPVTQRHSFPESFNTFAEKKCDLGRWMEKYTSELEMDNLGEIQKPKKLNTDS